MKETLQKIRNHRVTQGLHFYSFGLLKRLYDWVMRWGETKYATYALAILAFAESSFFPIPPDVLQLSLSLSKPKRSFWYAFVSGTFSVLGGLFGYFIGVFLFESIGKLIINGLGYQQAFQTVGQLYQGNAFLAVLAAAFTPIPYKIFTIAGGVWKISIWSLLLGSIIGRYGRFMIMATLIYFLGEKVKVFIEKYFNWLSLLAFILLIGGYLSIKYLI